MGKICLKYVHLVAFFCLICLSGFISGCTKKKPLKNEAKEKAQVSAPAKPDAPQTSPAGPQITPDPKRAVGGGDDDIKAFPKESPVGDSSSAASGSGVVASVPDPISVAAPTSQVTAPVSPVATESATSSSMASDVTEADRQSSRDSDLPASPPISTSSAVLHDGSRSAEGLGTKPSGETDQSDLENVNDTQVQNEKKDQDEQKQSQPEPLIVEVRMDRVKMWGSKNIFQSDPNFVGFTVTRVEGSIATVLNEPSKGSKIVTVVDDSIHENTQYSFGLEPISNSGYPNGLYSLFVQDGKNSSDVLKLEYTFSKGNMDAFKSGESVQVVLTQSSWERLSEHNAKKVLAQEFSSLNFNIKKGDSESSYGWGFNLGKGQYSIGINALATLVPNSLYIATQAEPRSAVGAEER